MEYKRIRINRTTELVIHYDDDPLNPREESDCFIGKMACWHSRYDLGDRDGKPYGADPHNFFDVLGGFEEDCYKTEAANERERMKAHRRVSREYTILPLFLYDHSGITMRTAPFSCPWDSGQVGWIYANNKEAREALGIKDGARHWRKRVEAALEAEVQEYDDYLTGNVYRFVIEENGENVDSCWGFSGDNFIENGLLDQAIPSKRTQYRIAREIGGATGRSVPKKRVRK